MAGNYKSIIPYSKKKDLDPISGVILQHETCYQKNDNGKSLLEMLKVTLDRIYLDK